MICNDGDDFLFYESGLELIKDLSSGYVSPDLILLEYKVFRNFEDVMYRLLKSMDLKIPVVMTGPSCQSRLALARCVSENEFALDFQIPCQTIRKIEKICTFIREKCIFDDLSEIVLNENTVPLKDFELPPVENNLLAFFYENRSRELSVEELEKQLDVKAESKIVRKNVVYSYISRLRNDFNKNLLSQMKIVRTKKGFYQLIISKKEGED